MTLALTMRGLIVRVPEPRWTELWSGVASLLWAAYVYLMPSELGQHAPYRVLGGVASDSQWATIGAVVGCAQVAFAIVNQRPGRAVANTLGSIFWTCLFTGIVAEHERDFPGIVLYFNQVLMNCFCLVLVLSAWILRKRLVSVM